MPRRDLAHLSDEAVVALTARSDDVALAEQLSRLLRSPAERERWSKAGRARTEKLTWQAGFAALFGVLLIVAQRRLSTPVRAVRRRLPDVEDAARAALVAGAEDALQAMMAAVVALAIALVILRAG